MRKLTLAMVAAVGLLLPAPAYAYHDGYDDDGGSSEYDSRDSGGNYGQNRRDEEYGNGSCKYFCPAFDRSPVEDSFNICLPGATCYYDGKKREGEGGQSEGR